MLRKGKINLRNLKAKILGMCAIDLSTARPKWRETPVTAYICLYQEINLIKFPFKRNGLPCCEDEPGSEKIALK